MYIRIASIMAKSKVARHSDSVLLFRQKAVELTVIEDNERLLKICSNLGNEMRYTMVRVNVSVNAIVLLKSFRLLKIFV